MDIMDLAVKALGSKLGGAGGSSDLLKGVVGKLVGAGDSLDLGGLVNSLKEKGMSSVADSWLGDGDNAEINESQVKELIGQDKIAEAASALGTDENSLLSGLKDMLPQLIDKSSKGGSLLDSIGGLGGLAKKFL